jgi:hypothetical protein
MKYSLLKAISYFIVGEKRKAYRLLAGKSEGKRLLGRPRNRWMNIIKLDLVEVVCGGVDWIGLAQDM